MYNGIFVAVFSDFQDIYIDRQARLAILINSFGTIKAIVKLETYQMDALLDDECKEYTDELNYLERRFEEEMYNEK